MYHYKDTWNLFKRYPKKFFGYFGFAEELLVLTVWPIFIFITLRDYQETGTLVTVASMFAAAIALYVGRLADVYSKRNMIKIGSVMYAGVWFLRIFASDSLSRSTKDVIFIPLSTVTYQRAESTHILPYVIFFEQSLAMGKLLSAILGIIVFTITGESYSAVFIFAGFASLLYMLI